jgi:hypothetical protein
MFQTISIKENTEHFKALISLFSVSPISGQEFSSTSHTHKLSIVTSYTDEKYFTVNAEVSLNLNLVTTVKLK